jgi:nitroreductase
MISFDQNFRQQLSELFVWRRDVRRFRPDPLPNRALEQLIEIACLSPSVGLSQPWRFVIVENEDRRRAVIDDFKVCNADALQSYSGERAARYATLKLAASRKRQVIWLSSLKRQAQSGMVSGALQCRKWSNILSPRLSARCGSRHAQRASELAGCRS